LIGLIGAILAICLPTYDAIRAPEITATSLSPLSQPFLEKFAIANKSLVFSMRNAQLLCIIYEAHGSAIYGAGFTVTDGTTANILPGRTDLYSCPFQKVVLNDQRFTKIRIKIWAKYQTIFFQRETQSEMFNWDSATTQWSKGEIIN